MIWTLSLQYWKQIAGVVAICFIIFAIDQNGANRVQARWDAETARFKLVAKQAEEQNKAVNKAINEQHKKDIDYAKSEAGKSAIRDYLKSHSLLPNSCSSQTNSTSLPYATGSELQPGGSLEEFAGRCAQDAITVGDWQERAKREGFKIESP
jgi:sRNA-binding protein